MRRPWISCEPVGTRSNAKGAWAWGVAGAGWESLENATVPGPRPAQHRHRTIYGIVARELVPRPMQPHHADGQLWPAAIVARLTMAYCTRPGARLGQVSHVHVRSYFQAPRGVWKNCAGCHILSPGLFWFFLISPHLCQGVQLAWQARDASAGSQSAVVCFASDPFGGQVR